MGVNNFLQTAPLFRVFVMIMAGILSGEFIFSSISPEILLVITACIIIASPFLRRSGTVQSALLLFAVYLIGLCSYRTAVTNTSFVKNGFYDYHAVVTSTVKHNNGYSTFDLTKTSENNGELKIKATVKGDLKVFPGDRLHIRSKISPPVNRKENKFSYADYLKRNGYAGTAFINSKNIEYAGNYNGDLSLWIRFKIKMLTLRCSMLEKLTEEGLEGRDFATVSAMAFGDKTYLTTADRDMYSSTGVSHVLALSGLHIGIIYAFLTFFMTFVPKIPRFVAIQTAVWFYVVFAGMSPSLIRAALMISVYSAGALMHREKLSVNSLSLAGTVSLLISPQTIFDLCFQLSFLSVFSIIIFYRPITRFLPSHPLAVRKIMQMTAISLAAYIGTLPVILYNFGSMSFCFIITNLIVIPLTTAVVYLAILSFLPIIGTLIVTLLASVVHIMNTFVSCMASLNYAAIDNVYISIKTMILLYVIMFSVFFIYDKLSKEEMR